MVKGTAQVDGLVIIAWTQAGKRDIERVDSFLSIYDPLTADRIVEEIYRAAGMLALHPELGVRIPRFKLRNVRKLIASNYEIRYELAGATIFILRIWHEKEDRI